MCDKDTTTETPTVEREKKTPQDKVEKNDIEATSYVNGEYSIPNCIEILRKPKLKRLLKGRLFTYALELIKDSKNRVIVVSLKDWIDDLATWIDYKHVKHGRKEVEKDDNGATSYINGEYSIPNCIEVLRNLKKGGHLNGQQLFGCALELLKDSKNRVIVVSLKDCMRDLGTWISDSFEKGEL